MGEKRDLINIENQRAVGMGIEMRDKAFVAALLRHDGKIVPAHREVFNARDISATTRLREGKRILNKQSVQNYMKQVMNTQEISPEFVLGGIAKIAKEAQKDGDKLHGLELLGKFLKIFKVEGTGGAGNTYNINLSEDAAKRLLERRTKHEIGGRGEFLDLNPESDSQSTTDRGSDSDGEEKSD